jgi:glycosyltransferase involved in cell wall biosynthesis
MAGELPRWAAMDGSRRWRATWYVALMQHGGGRVARVALLDGLFYMPQSVSIPKQLVHFERALAAGFAVERLPPDYLDRDARGRRASLARILSRCDCAIVPGVVLDTLLLETFAARPRPSFPFIYMPFGELPRGAFNLRVVLPLLGRRDTILVHCHADKRIIERLTASCRARVRVVPLGVDSDVFRPLEPSRRAEVRRALGVGPDDVVMTYAGRVCAEKNVHGALAAFQEVASRDRRLHFVICGPLRDEYFPEFRTGPYEMGPLLEGQLARTPKLARRVHFTRFPAATAERKVAELCGASDFYINLTLTHDECFGYSAVEGMSSGLPVVATYWGGQQDTVEDRATGFHVDTWVSGTGIRFDFADTVRACESLTRSDAARRRMGRAARERVLDGYSLARLQRNLCAAVREALRRPRGRARTTHLSAFGKAFSDAFSRPPLPQEARWMRGRRVSEIPVYHGEAHMALYRQLIGPYARGDARAPQGERDVLFLRSPFMRVTPGGVDCDDPLWPTRHAFGPRRARVVEALLHDPFLTVCALRRALGEGYGDLDGALSELCSHGTVVSSSRPMGRRAAGER